MIHIAFLSILAVVATAAEPRLVTALHQSESTRSLTVQGQHLWVGKTPFKASETDNSYEVELFDTTSLKSVKSVALSHPPSFLYRLDSDRVMALGMAYAPLSEHPYQSRYTILSKTGEILETYSFPNSVETGRYVNEFAPYGVIQLFSAVGGENRVLTKLSNGKLESLRPKVVRPGKLVVVEDAVFALERDSFANIIRINLKTQESEALLGKEEQLDFTDLEWSEAARTLVASDYNLGKLYLLDRAGKQVGKLHFPESHLWAVEIVEHCAMIGAEERFVSLIDLKNQTELTRWDFSSVAGKLQRIENIAFDPKTHQVFVKSAYPEPFSTSSRNSVYAMTLDDFNLRQCLKQQSVAL